MAGQREVADTTVARGRRSGGARGGGGRGGRGGGRAAAVALAVALLAFACGTGDGAADAGGGSADTGTAGAGTTITLLTHDSFSLSPATLAGFTAETGIVVEQLAVGDAGTLVAQAVLTKDDPLGDVLFGIDSTFLQRGLDAGIFEPYRPPALDDIADGLRADLGLDPEHRVTPVDYGDVCVNYWIAGVATPPTSLDDLVKPEYAGQLVVQHPETSSPGLAFLLATIAAYGDGWEDYWTALRANGVAVAAGWEDAYYGDFAAGGGPRSLVVSYASSPTAEVMFADPPVVSAPTGVVVDSCFRQVEYAGVLAGTDNPAAARRLIDFMLSPAWQDDVPLNMFVYPVVASTALPAVFVRHTAVPDDPLTLAPAEIEAGRDAWTQRWVEIVLR